MHIISHQQRKSSPDKLLNSLENDAGIL